MDRRGFAQFDEAVGTADRRRRMGAIMIDPWDLTRLVFPMQGDFAAGGRTLPAVGVPGDFATGARQRPRVLLVGTGGNDPFGLS